MTSAFQYFFLFFPRSGSIQGIGRSVGQSLLPPAFLSKYGRMTFGATDNVMGVETVIRVVFEGSIHNLPYKLRRLREYKSADKKLQTIFVR